MDSFRLFNEDDGIVARAISPVAPLEYLKSKHHLTRFDPNEELIFFPEVSIKKSISTGRQNTYYLRLFRS